MEFEIGSIRQQRHLQSTEERSKESILDHETNSTYVEIYERYNHQ